MNKPIAYTGGDNKSNRWPHPLNDEFNDIIRNTVNIYGVGPENQLDLLKECKEYLHSRIKGLLEHRIRRETEEYYRTLNLTIDHGFGKDQNERQKLIEDASYLMCVGDWLHDEDCLQQYRIATMYSKPVFEMRFEKSVPIEKIIRYLQPVRPIKDNAWDPEQRDPLLIYETPEGLLELIDGNHRHEFANRVGGVEFLPAWIIKEV